MKKVFEKEQRESILEAHQEKSFMQLKSLNVYFFFILLTLVGVAVFFIFRPFITAIIAAAIISALFKRPYNFLERVMHGHRGIAAFFTCILVILIIVTPILIVLSMAIGEASSIYGALGEQTKIEQFIDKTITLSENVPILNLVIDRDTLNQERLLLDAKQLSGNALGLLQAAYTSISHFIFWIFVMFFTLFYFLIDGKRALRYIMRMSPLRNEHDKLLVEKFVSISRATLKGTLVVGAIQGFIGGVVFWIAGVPSPAIWGFIMLLFSMIPLVGTAVVWLPTALIMLALGNVWQGVFIIAVGAGVISTIDNILRPKLVGRDTQMHPLMIFFATLGGISVFGLPGFIMGPIIISLFMALGEIYSIEFRDQL
ncbi:MAG: AI-2E family transporter, partial [Patescibacteria group bacterium]